MHTCNIHAQYMYTCNTHVTYSLHVHQLLYILDVTDVFFLHVSILAAIILYCGFHLHSFQFSSVAQSCLTLCDPMNCSTPGPSVHHQLQDFAQTHVHRVGDAIQPSHPLSSPSPPAPNPSQHQSLFQ